MWLLKPQPPTSNYNPNAVFVSHLMLALGGFLFALSPFEVAVDYRADSIISPWKLFVFGGEEENQSPQCKCQKWGGELMMLLDHTFLSGTNQYSILPLMSIPESVSLIATTPQTGREGGIGTGFSSANWLLGWKVTLEV